MLTDFSFAFKANKTRTKLLLFIDQEIHFKVKQKKLFYNFQHENEENTDLFSNINKTYSHRQSTSFVSFSIFEETISKNDLILKKNCLNSQKSASTCTGTPSTKGKIYQGKNLRNIPICCSDTIKKTKLDNYCLLYNNCIKIKEKFYSINKVLKPSSTLQIYKKPKTDKKYLLNLCASFKIINKSDLFIHKKTKSKVSCALCNVNKKESSPIKKANKKQSCRIKSSINNLCY